MGYRRSLAALLALVVGAVLAQAGSVARGQEGGVLRVGISQDFGLDTLDPALSFSPAGWSLLEATCARLYTYPDKPSPGSYRLQPELAAGHSVSKDLKTHTFTLRRGFRFSNGEPVRASAFARAVNRALQVKSIGADYFMRDIVGADAVLAGRAAKARGVVARGHTLVVRFERPAPDFPARTALPFFCAVPPWLPESREGLGRIPSAGPYYVTEYRPDERIEIRRNRFYRGERKVQLDGFDVDLRGGNPVALLRSIERGDFDWGVVPAGVFATEGLGLEAKYGRNTSRYWVQAGLTLRTFVFNSSRPLFRNNPRLRQAVNVALDRRALVESSYGPVRNSWGGPTEAAPPTRAPAAGKRRPPHRDEEREMTMYGRSSRWATVLTLGLAGLIGGGAATAPAAPANHAASAFGLKLVAPESTSKGTFSSRAPFCARGTFTDLLVVPTIPIGYRRLTCEDGSGSLTVDFGTTEVWRPWGAKWEIFDGTGSYAKLRGRGSLRGEVLGDKIDALLGGAVTWRSTLEGVVDRDAVAPTITLSRATATKLRRPAGAFRIRLTPALRDDVEGHPVSYTLRVTALGGTELARRFGTTTKPTLPLTLRINPREARAKGVWLELDAEDPIGNASSLSRSLKLPR